ncbi:BrnT family toxin [Desulfobacterium sp. N47]|uniref:BrnT family toxin n=1 Tax=uncultured Desulfobacterium sp. TaxID=201089 RepID=E1Y9V3_9BACT|nr:hypothetical protein N47_H21690 [uncultured Desulfobacterium sp.]
MAISYNFEWDPVKARENRDKHAVTFDEAASVFKDSKALSKFDSEHSETEDRWLTLGISERGRLLVLIHTFQEDSKEAVTIRIISCRKATKHESKIYGE